MNQITTERAVNEEQFEVEMAYPTIKQGWGIIGLFILVAIVSGIPYGVLKAMHIAMNDDLFSLLNYSIPLIILILITRKWWSKNLKNKGVLTFNSFPIVILPIVAIMTAALLIVNVEITSWVPMPAWLLEIFKDAVIPISI